MEVKFINKHLEELYSTGKSKKYNMVPADVIKKLPRAVIILEQIEIIQDIWKYPGYNFEKLEGVNQYSIRLGRTWRLIMKLIGPMKKKQLESLVWKI